MRFRIRREGKLQDRGIRRRNRWQMTGLVCLGLVVLGAILLESEPRGAEAAVSPPDLEERVREIASGLRCVVCQNLSVADSPSELAKEMRNLVRELLQQGKTREEIYAYFVSRYGEFVLLSPPKRGFNLLVWGLPFFAITAGAWGVYVVTKRWTMQREQAAPAVDPAYAERVRRELEKRAGRPGS